MSAKTWITRIIYVENKFQYLYFLLIKKPFCLYRVFTLIIHIFFHSFLNQNFTFSCIFFIPFYECQQYLMSIFYALKCIWILIKRIDDCNSIFLKSKRNGNRSMPLLKENIWNQLQLCGSLSHIHFFSDVPLRLRKNLMEKSNYIILFNNLKKKYTYKNEWKMIP